ncbi:MAG: alpha/beta hydrolase, partial [Candidatus Omnitrophota bacterium]
MNMKGSLYITVVLLVVIFLCGCATLPMFMNRQSRADNIAVKSGFIREYIRAGDFNLLSYQKIAKSSKTIRIYIEGDGNAWETKHRLSDDPTPRQPVALYLACEDTFASIVYIARPGQYSSSGFADCDSKYWSGSRFAPEIIVSFNRAIDILKEKSNAKYVELIGYSGGAAIVVLVAARRSDVIALRTVAGNLNPHMLSVYHHVSQL